MKNTFTYRIYYEDTDAGGVVYYANYLRFLERARADFLIQNGILQSHIARDGILFVVRKCDIEYILPAKLEDEIIVECKIAKLSPASITFQHSITANSKILIKALVKIVCVRSTEGVFKPIAMPQNIQNLFKKYIMSHTV